jgi:hypothetical protein
MSIRDALGELSAEAAQERRQFKQNATAWDYIREFGRMFVAFAILGRVMTQSTVAASLGIEPHDDDVTWSALDTPIHGIPPLAEFTGRTLQAALAASACLGAYLASNATGGVLALLALNAGILVADPVLMITDKLQDYGTN